MTEAHEDPRFTNAVTYTVAITVTVAGGARCETAHRRAERLAERLADHAARAKHAVEVTAVTGMSHDGEILSRRRVRFPLANSGQGTYADRDKLDRYLDPDHERAQASLAEANQRQRRRREAERDRRLAVGCANAWRSSSWETAVGCQCVYCVPDRHLDTRTGLASGLAFLDARCLCGQPAPAPPNRCTRHRDVAIVVLDDDPDALIRLAEITRNPR